MEKSFQIENLAVKTYGETKAMGEAAADYVAGKLQTAISEKGAANLILATGASQFSFLEALQTREIDWKKITVFHLDEYKGLSESHPASFRKYLKERILNRVAPKKIYFLNGDAENLQLEINKYEEALQLHPIDIACIGIGENGHIAFNDPAVADFKDPKLVKVVELDEACRNQQLGEGWFPTFADVPKEAVTLTITAIMNCKAISCVVPDERKAQAVYNSLYGDISTSCPASILRTHPETVLFLDKGSASMIK
ncbi:MULTISPECIES: glucosamine-6-phosphate deaminase [Arenibacter]|uniref:glucosamine-6-phosphate deaminase n=1 Tax=Arenibacter TaxID=178469 RepID=UPI001C077433|nr:MULTISPECIES: glucosamine-6-phosphate deaminase [Arenibacter]MBU2906116.1 glucosamine-6-phosphate deaminase [Arenibacter algicola]MCK0136362.1 glucosamine-6-phosphate deaminase [Arenibacter sp. S6351L]